MKGGSMSKKKWVPKDLAEMTEAMEKVVALKGLSKEGEDCKDLLSDCDDLDSLLEEPDALLAIGEVAFRLGVSEQTIRNWEQTGKLVPQRTEKGHRRYSSKDVDNIKKKMLANQEYILHDMCVAKLKDTLDMLFSAFEPEDLVNITVRVDDLERHVKIVVDSTDSMSSISKTFKMED
jgi:DNA-binding transcriptional MerR regulator